MKTIYYFLLLTMSAFSLAESYTSVEVSARSLDFNYKEYDKDNSVLNSESGLIPGLGVQFERRNPKWRFKLNFDYFEGDVSYIGMNQVGIPLSSNTFQRISYLQAQVSRELLDPRFGVYLSIAQNEWKRTIRATALSTELREKYRWSNVDSGFYVVLDSGASHQLDWNFGFSFLNDGDLSVDLSLLGLNHVEVELKGGRGWNTSMLYKRRITSSVSANIGLLYKQWQFERGAGKQFSNGFQVFTITEPRSNTRTLQGLLGLSFEF